MRNLDYRLQAGSIAPVYLFYGEEDYWIDEYLARLAAAVDPAGTEWSRELYWGDETELAEIVAAANSPGLFAQRKLIVVRRAPWFKPKRKADAAGAAEDAAAGAPTGAPEEEKKADTTALLDYLAAPNPDTVLVFVAAAVNKTLKLVKAIQEQGCLAEFVSPKGMERERWLADYLRAAGRQAERGVVSCVCALSGESLYALKSEADKLLLYTQGRPTITLREAETVTSPGVQAGVFELTDRAAARDAAGAIQTLRRLVRQGEVPYMLTGMLAAQYRNMLAVQDMQRQGFSSAAMPKELGVHPYAVKKCLAAARAYTPRQLQQALVILLNADIAGKTGEGEMAELLETALLRICNL